MAQAKTFTQGELDQVLRYLAKTRYSARNRALVLMSFWSGMRVGEIARLTIAHVRSEDGSIKQEVRLAPWPCSGPGRAAWTTRSRWWATPASLPTR